jgi:hypothetical protein
MIAFNDTFRFCYLNDNSSLPAYIRCVYAPLAANFQNTGKKSLWSPDEMLSFDQ